MAQLPLDMYERMRDALLHLSDVAAPRWLCQVEGQGGLAHPGWELSGDL